MQNRFLTMTMTKRDDRYTPYKHWVGHGGHGGHAVFTHTYARACERTRLPPLLCHCLTYVKNTMTTMSSMTKVDTARVLAVTVGGHRHIQGDQANHQYLFSLRGILCN
jgi:hypothetical protein